MMILVTGGLGFIGSNFVRYLVEDVGVDGSETTVVDALIHMVIQEFLI